jgi:hypothetical protein
MEAIRKLLDSKELAEITGRSVRSIERDRETGDGCPYVRFGRLIRYRPEDVEKHIAAHVLGSGTASLRPSQSEVAPRGDVGPTPSKPQPPRRPHKSCGGVT